MALITMATIVRAQIEKMKVTAGYADACARRSTAVVMVRDATIV